MKLNGCKTLSKNRLTKDSGDLCEPPAYAAKHLPWVSEGLRPPPADCTKSDSSFVKSSPKILEIAPPRLGLLSGLMAHHFQGAVDRSANLAAQYEQRCILFGCHFFDSNQVVAAAEDGIHLDAQGHSKLALALLPMVKSLAADVDLAV